MRNYNHQQRSGDVHIGFPGFFPLLALAFLLVGVATQDAWAQGIPPRVQILQTIKPIEPAPVSQVERLRLGIIDATNQYGQVDKSKLTRRYLWSLPRISGQPLPGDQPPPMGMIGTRSGGPLSGDQPPPAGSLGTSGGSALNSDQPPPIGVGKLKK
jgi:hypothetical protein